MSNAFTNAEKQREAEREVKQRHRVYKRLVEAGKMKQEAADRQIAIMSEIARDYAVKAEADAAVQTMRLL